MIKKLKLENDLFLREITIDAGGIYTSSFFSKSNEREYNKRLEVAEFQFQINGELITSYSKPEIHILDGSTVDIKQILEPVCHEFTASSRGSRILKISLRCKKYDFVLRACYEIYPDLEGCAKWLEIDCLSEDIHIRTDIHRYYQPGISLGGVGCSKK